MKGYLKSKDVTEKCFENEWLKTGDVVLQNEEGYFFVVDRLKNMIKVNGMQVAPTELVCLKVLQYKAPLFQEQLILTFSYVTEAAVIGIQDADYG